MLSNSEKLEALDKRILRFILNDYTSHYTTLLNKIEVTSLYKRAHSEFLILVHRSLFFSQYPTYLRNICDVRCTTYNLRGTHMFSLSKNDNL